MLSKIFPLKINSLKKADIFLIIFLIIQPIFDLKIFYNSISTLIRVVIILGFFSYYFLTNKNNKKYYLLIYPLLVFVYFIFHHINAMNFNSLVPGNFNYSIIKEGLYFVKMLCPFLLIYSIYKSNLSKNMLLNIIKFLVCIIGIIIIISNIFVFSYGSYSDIQIKANFFEWFNPSSSYNYYDLASKGLFEFGNQIAAILIIFLPFSIYKLLDNKHWSNWLALISNIFALILLCTKVSVLGIFVVFVYSISSFIFISFIRKKPFLFKKYIPICTVLLVSALLLPVNPMFSRINERNTVIQTFSETTTEVEENIVTEELVEKAEPELTIPNIVTEKVPSLVVDNNQMMLDYIENTYKSKKLHKQFLFDNYPYQYDPEFWYNFLQNDISLTTDYRYIETSMVKRVVKINNNPADKFLGITNTRLQNVFNIEKDFVVQYYALGIIGLILIFTPYFIFIICFGYRTIKSNLKNLDALNLLSIITIIFAFGISYITGNLLNSLSFTIYFSLLFLLLFKNEKIDSL